jgi:uncharacterized protein
LPFQSIPRELAFFDLFERQATNLADAARTFEALVQDPATGEDRGVAIHDIEHAGDRLAREVFALLDTTFVTPFDREDVFRLSSALDDILDMQWAAADLFVLHRIDEPLPEVAQLADVLVRATRVVVHLVASLRTLRGLNAPLIEINRLENEGDRIYRRAVARLYSGQFKAMDVLKWKDIVDAVEAALDGCEDVANVIEAIALKQA